MTHPPLILASQSAIRAAILQQHGITFDIVPANIDERAFDALDAPGLAKAKALFISAKYPNHWVIGADQICHLNGVVFHKPGTIDKAIHTLQQLEGNTHTLITAACIAHHHGIIWEGLDDIKLTMHPLSLSKIKSYVAKDMPLQSCGAYCYEKDGKKLFTHVTHPPESIQGLPLEQLLNVILNSQKTAGDANKPLK